MYVLFVFVGVWFVLLCGVVCVFFLWLVVWCGVWCGVVWCGAGCGGGGGVGVWGSGLGAVGWARVAIVGGFSGLRGTVLSVGPVRHGARSPLRH